MSETSTCGRTSREAGQFVEMRCVSPFNSSHMARSKTHSKPFLEGVWARRIPGKYQRRKKAGKNAALRKKSNTRATDSGLPTHTHETRISLQNCGANVKANKEILTGESRRPELSPTGFSAKGHNFQKVFLSELPKEKAKPKQPGSPQWSPPSFLSFCKPQTAGMSAIHGGRWRGCLSCLESR